VKLKKFRFCYFRQLFQVCDARTRQRALRRRGESWQAAG
jgi:hypothetical protein